MVVRKIPRSRPKGAVVLETAVIISLVLTMILGVFTYARLLADWSLLNNAAREGCRYALANNTSSTVSSSVQSIVNGYMGGEISRFNNWSVTVSGQNQAGVATPVNNLGPGDFITVTVSGTYNFLQIIPLIKMPTNLVVKSGVTMVCEGGT